MSLTRSLNTLVVCAAFLFVVAIVAGVNLKQRRANH